MRKTKLGWVIAGKCPVPSSMHARVAESHVAVNVSLLDKFVGKCFALEHKPKMSRRDVPMNSSVIHERPSEDEPTDVLTQLREDY